MIERNVYEINVNLYHQKNIFYTFNMYGKDDL